MNRAERRASGAKQPLILSNLVYGALYPSLWTDNHLKSLLDPTNIPAIKDKYDVQMAVFTDDATLMQISRHPNFMQLSNLCEIHIVKMNWPPESDQFNSRYQLLVQMFHQMLPVALEKDAWMGSWVADLVFAKHALPRMLKRLEAGHDAVFNVPIRSAADSINHILAGLPGAPTDLELFELAYKNLHHLWVASHWDSPLFSKFPYSMLWNSGTGLVAHNFGITPIIFKPSEELKAVKGVIDADVPSFFKNPFWATDWTDAPVAGVEPLSNGHYPPFLVHRASKEFVADWAVKGTMPCQAEYTEHPLYYPSKATFNAPALAKQALETVLEIKQRIAETK